jgi:indole-3-acetate monooxygenase
MAADYRHIGSLENRLGRHYSRFLAFWPAPALAGQSLALRKLCDAGSNRRSRDSARQAMDLMYRHGGSTSFRRESRLAECWCHLHTVAQTVSLSPEWYPIGERAYLSIDPGRRQG